MPPDTQTNYFTNVKDFGAVGDGATDDTDAINNAIEYQNSLGGGVVAIPPGTYMVKADDPDATTTFLHDEGGIELMDNIALVMHGATLKSIPNSDTKYVVLRCYMKNNVSIYGGKIQGERDEHTGETGEWGYGLAITASNDVAVYGTKFIDCWGDGVNIQQSGGENSQVSNNLYFNNIVCDNNRRQGMSVEGVHHLVVENSTFSNTSGALPSCGVDIEPYNVSTPVHDMTFRSCRFINNDNSGLLAMTGGVRGLVVDSCYFSNNSITQTNGQLTTYYSDSVKNTKIVNCTFENAVTSLPGILLQGGSDYIVSGNSVERGIIIKDGMEQSSPHHVSVTNNIVTELHTEGTMFDTCLTMDCLDLRYINNTFDLSKSYNGRSIIRLERCTDTVIKDNSFISSPRSISIFDSYYTKVDSNTSDNAGVAFLEISGDSHDTDVTNSRVYGACNNNSDASMIYAFGSTSLIRIDKNKFYQKPRVTDTYGFGEFHAAIAFGRAIGSAIDTKSSANTVTSDGVNEFSF
jgi:hypothetical protein